MKNSVSSQYEEIFKKELFLLGSRLYEETFYHVLDGVVQTLMLRQVQGSFTVSFDILPLCFQITDLYCEGYDIDSKREVEWEYFDGNTPGHRDRIFLELERMRKYCEHGDIRERQSERVLKDEERSRKELEMIDAGIPMLPALSSFFGQSLL